jgi:hypothetical protein
MTIIPRVEHGYWIVVAILLLMSAPAVFESIGGETFLARTAICRAIHSAVGSW